MYDAKYLKELTDERFRLRDERTELRTLINDPKTPRGEKEEIRKALTLLDKEIARHTKEINKEVRKDIPIK